MTQKIYNQLKKISKRLKKEYQAKEVILFGSFAEGKATEESDVDLLVIAPVKEKFFKRIARVKYLIRDIRKGLAIAPIVLKPEEIEKRKKINDQFINQILAKGKVI